MSRVDERELLAFAAEIAGHRRPIASSALRERLRGSLIAAPVTASRGPAFAWLRAGPLRRVVVGLVVFGIVAAAGGAAAASSLPGDPAFALKRAAERFQATLAPDDAARLDILVTQSDRRLGDLKTASNSRPSSATTATDEYRAAVDRMDAALASLLARPATPARDAAIVRAAAASADHIAALHSLAAQLPAGAQQAIERAIEAQQTVRGKSDNAPDQPEGPGGGRPSNVPNGAAPGRGAPPIKAPGRP